MGVLVPENVGCPEYQGTMEEAFLADVREVGCKSGILRVDDKVTEEIGNLSSQLAVRINTRKLICKIEGVLIAPFLGRIAVSWRWHSENWTTLDFFNGLNQSSRSVPRAFNQMRHIALVK